MLMGHSVSHDVVTITAWKRLEIIEDGPDGTNGHVLHVTATKFKSCRIGLWCHLPPDRKD